MTLYTGKPVDQYANLCSGMGDLNDEHLTRYIIEAEPHPDPLRVGILRYLGPPEFVRLHPSGPKNYWMEVPDEAGPARLVSFEEWARLVHWPERWAHLHPVVQS